jgi:exodeoxyribonuclease VII large subunit
MGTEPADDHATLEERLDADEVTFVDSLNDDLATLVEDADHLQFDYLVGDISDYGISSNDHAHFDLVHNDSSIHCVCFEYRIPGIDANLDSGMQAAVKGKLSYYEDGGSISVIVDDVVGVGDGVYQQTYEENRQILEDDGLLDPATRRKTYVFRRSQVVAVGRSLRAP